MGFKVLIVPVFLTVLALTACASAQAVTDTMDGNWVFMQQGADPAYPGRGLPQAGVINGQTNALYELNPDAASTFLLQPYSGTTFCN